MRLSLLTAGALCHAYDDVFLEGLASGLTARSSGLAQKLTADVEGGRLSVKQYEELAGYLLAERAGLLGSVYKARPDLVSRRERMAREVGVYGKGVVLQAP